MGFFCLFVCCFFFCFFVCLCSGFLFIYFLLILFFFFVVAASWREGCVHSSCCVFFLLSLCRGKGYFILRVGGVRDSSSAGQGLT